MILKIRRISNFGLKNTSATLEFLKSGILSLGINYSARFGSLEEVIDIDYKKGPIGISFNSFLAASEKVTAIYDLEK